MITMSENRFIHTAQELVTGFLSNESRLSFLATTRDSLAHEQKRKRKMEEKQSSRPKESVAANPESVMERFKKAKEEAKRLLASIPNPK